MAMSAYYLKGVGTPSLLLTQIFRGCMPFLYVVLLSMVMIYIYPSIALWLPSAIYGK
jgi:TRAP-type mannitol/chloroaromatic compound transport system permease large subunit